MGENKVTYTGNEIAVVGMSGEFPKCTDMEEYWNAIVKGEECISFYTKEQLKEAGINPEVLKFEEYIRAKGEIPDIGLFDAGFFHISPREAELMDPQHRLLLQCAWQALESAGINPDNYKGTIGVYAGKSLSSYLYLNIFPHLKKIMAVGNLQAAIGNDKDSMTTTIAYHMNLKGPAVTIQSSSSTSLVAVCMACQALLNYQCDAVLTGGITAGPPNKSGYLFEQGGIYSNDGHGHSFNEGSTGFVPGNGYGLAVLKRLEDAIEDGDNIWAVIKGFAVNNDGSDKISYTAPSVDGHAEVVEMAQAMAEVSPETIEFMESHGTGTKMGDPIEVAGLTKAFRKGTDKKQYCSLGSVKANIGHLDSAAGIAGFMKAVLTVNKGILPPLCGFQELNPEINLEDSPFYISTKAKPWIPSCGVRRAGISSLGMGGTNAHVIVEEPPVTKDSDNTKKVRIIPLSGKTVYSLEENRKNLSSFLKAHADEKLADVAYTLSLGRKDFLYRDAIACNSIQDAIEQLDEREGYVECMTNRQNTVFMFPGQGTQYPGMMYDLYKKYPVFQENLKECRKYILEFMETDILDYLNGTNQNEEELENTRFAQPVIFATSYCATMLYQSFGIKPSAMIGHSLGEYVAAAVAGVFSLRDALYLVCNRARLMSEAERGAMLSVRASATTIKELTDANVNIAAINAPSLCVVSGTIEEIEKAKEDCKRHGIFVRLLKTSHAFHSNMMKEVAKEYGKLLQNVEFKKPEIPYISCVDGTWADMDSVSAAYWEKHITVPVNFAAGIETLLNKEDYVFVEVGAGNTLSTLASYQKITEDKLTFISAGRMPKETVSDEVFFMNSLASLWSHGVAVDWEAVYAGERRKKTYLPGYAFDRSLYWVDAPEDNDLYTEPIAQKAKEEPGVEVNAKDKKKVTKKYHKRPKLHHGFVEASNETEKILAGILKELLRIEPVGVTDSFFELGGQSLLAAQFLSNIHDVFPVHINMNEIFEYDTAQKLAKRINTMVEQAEDKQSVENLLDDILSMDDETVESLFKV